MRVSKLRPYSLGIVARNKPLNSIDIEVTPIEDAPMLDGEVTDNVTTLNASGVDASGASYKLEMDTTVSIRATWLPVSQGNRMTPPDVRRGEQVMIYRFGDADKYYWDTLRNDLRFRKLETVIYGFSATTDEDAKPDETNTYVIEISSHEKHIRIHTSQANGEPFGYDIKLDTGNGTFKLIDTIGNVISLDSGEHSWHIENASGSFVDMTKHVLTMQTAERIDMTTKATTLATETLDIKASSSATLTTETNTITATTTHNGDTTHVGNTLHQGNIALQGVIGQTPGGGGGGGGKSSFSDPVSFDNKVEVANNLDVTGEMHAGKVISDQPISAPNV